MADYRYRQDADRAMDESNKMLEETTAASLLCQLDNEILRRMVRPRTPADKTEFLIDRYKEFKRRRTAS